MNLLSLQELNAKHYVAKTHLPRKGRKITPKTGRDSAGVYDEWFENKFTGSKMTPQFKTYQRDARPVSVKLLLSFY